MQSSAMQSAAWPAVLALTAVMVRLSVGPVTIDDAYITFRYSRNLAEGLGFVYNLGEYVLGTTTPLWTLVLAGLRESGLTDLPRVSHVLSSIADGVACALLVRLGARLEFGPWGLLLGLLFALNPFSIYYAVSGMESSLFVLLVLGALYTDSTQRRAVSGLLAAMATLTRPEGLLVAGLILLRDLAVVRGLSWRFLIAFVLTLVPWVGFAYSRFNSPVPQSLIAKASVGNVHPVYNVGVVLRQMGVPGFNSQMHPDDWRTLAGEALGLLIVSFVYLKWRTFFYFIKARPRLWPLALFAPSLGTIYSLASFKSTRVWEWYLVPMVPFYLTAVVAAARHAALRKSGLWMCTTILVLLCWTAMGLEMWRKPGHSPFTPVGIYTVRERAYIQVAHLLKPYLGPNVVVALPEIGAFGYATDARILDTMGLVSPVATHFYQLNAEKALTITNLPIPSELVQTMRPDYVVALDEFFTSLLSTEWFRRDYRLAFAVEARIWRSNEVRVYHLIAAKENPESR